MSFRPAIGALGKKPILGLYILNRVVALRMPCDASDTITSECDELFECSVSIVRQDRGGESEWTAYGLDRRWQSSEFPKGNYFRRRGGALLPAPVARS
jgi:hypothetical protein